MIEINYEIFINNIGNLSKKYNIPRNKALIDSGVGKDFVTNISKGSAPSIDKIFKLANYFNVSIDYLLGLEAEPNRKTPLSEDKQRLLEMYDKLTDMEKGEILGELKILTQNKFITVSSAARSTDNSIPAKLRINNLDNLPTMDEE